MDPYLTYILCLTDDEELEYLVNALAEASEEVAEATRCTGFGWNSETHDFIVRNGERLERIRAAAVARAALLASSLEGFTPSSSQLAALKNRYNPTAPETHGS